jgi:hypothetical protein
LKGKRQKSRARNKSKVPADAGLTQAITAAGSRYRLAKLLNLTPVAVQKWTRVPIGRVLDVEKVCGIGREKLRPEFYR